MHAAVAEPSRKLSSEHLIRVKALAVAAEQQGSNHSHGIIVIIVAIVTIVTIVTI